MITLKPLARSAIDRVAHLILPAQQEPFVGAIAEMTDDPSSFVDLHHAIHGEDVVGFFKIDRDFSRVVDRLPTGTFAMRGLLIGGQFQGRGYGAALLAALPDYLRRTYPGVSDIWLSVDDANSVAIACYQVAGWVISGPHRNGRSGTEYVMRLVLSA